MWIMYTTVSLIVAIICLFSVVGYSAFGSSIREIITLNLPHDQLSDFTLLFFIFGLITSIAIVSMPVFDAYESTSLYK